MKRKKTVWIVGMLACAGLIAASVTSGCGGGGGSSDNSVTRLAPSTLYGSWRLVQVSGGIAGGGYPLEKETTVTFDQSGRAVQSEAGQVTFNKLYHVNRTTTQFGGTLPVLEYLPVGSGVPYVITRSDTTHLTLSQKAADGFQYDYERML